jgi:nucleotide-binding universal stress UspA family protein
MPDQRGFRSILVPLDGQPLAEQAVPVGRSVARRCGAALHLVTVQPPISPLVLSSDVAGMAQQMQAATALAMGAYVERVAATAQCDEITVASALLEGPPAERLAAYVREHGIELVVMTTHGRGGLSRLWLGSVADRLLRKLEVPVLLLRPREGPQPTEYRRVLVALGERAELEVVEPALTLGAFAGTTSYVLAHVVEPPPPILAPAPVHAPGLGPEWIQARHHAALRYLGPLAERLSQHGLAVETRVVVGGPIAAEVLELARKTGADLIAMGTHGKQGLERLVLGSVADKVVRGSDGPVLVTPAFVTQPSSGFRPPLPVETDSV